LLNKRYANVRQKNKNKKEKTIIQRTTHARAADEARSKQGHSDPQAGELNVVYPSMNIRPANQPSGQVLIQLYISLKVDRAIADTIEVAWFIFSLCTTRIVSGVDSQRGT
jgi:hypothetical protein